jgi:hypothetical protein
VSFSYLRLWCITFVLALFVSLTLFFLFSSAFQVISIRVSREDRRVDTEEIQELLKPYFGRHILFISPLLIKHEIQSAYPEVSLAVVKRNFPQELFVTLYMDPILAEILIGEPDHTEADFSAIQKEESQQKLYSYLTSKGAYLEYPFPFASHAGEKRLTIHLVDWAVKPTHRQKLMNEDVFDRMRSIARILHQSFGHSISFITYYHRAREFHVQIESNVLWFDLSTPVVKQINRYREFLRAVPLEKVEQYIDLRLHDRVAYR